tara:strand:+ start:57 stop:278 length:222 start_codon:yes stop_codon:yes gene_type:complete
MITERDNEIKVMNYAADNHYTILANTFGALEYVKYCYKNCKTTEFLKWPKGSDTLTITKEGVSKKIKLSELRG